MIYKTFCLSLLCWLTKSIRNGRCSFVHLQEHRNCFESFVLFFHPFFLSLYFLFQKNKTKSKMARERGGGVLLDCLSNDDQLIHLRGSGSQKKTGVSWDISPKKKFHKINVRSLFWLAQQYPGKSLECRYTVKNVISKKIKFQKCWGSNTNNKISLLIAVWSLQFHIWISELFELLYLKSK